MSNAIPRSPRPLDAPVPPSFAPVCKCPNSAVSPNVDIAMCSMVFMIPELRPPPLARIPLPLVSFEKAAGLFICRRRLPKILAFDGVEIVMKSI